MTSPSPSPDAPIADGEPTPRRIATVLAVIFAIQVLAMVVIVAGAVALMVTFAHNNSLECTTALNPVGGCAHYSYALAIGLLSGGFGTFLVGMVVSATYAMRHVGAPVLGALRARRRLWDQQSQSNVAPPSL